MWKTVKLGDVCDFQGGSQPPKKEFVYEEQKGYVRFIQIRDFKSDKNLTYIPVSNKNRLCRTDDIFIGRYGASVGQILRGLEGAYNVALMKTIPNEEFISKGWLFAYLNSSLFQKPLKEVSSRSAQNGFSKDDISSFELPLPPLAEQERIVAKLDTVFAEIDEAISEVEAKENEVQKLKASLLSSSLNSDAVTWSTAKLGEICILNYGKGLDKKDRSENAVIPVYGANGIKAYTDKLLHDKPSIIIGRKGSAGELNKVTKPFWALDVTYYVTTDESIVDIDFLFYVLATLNLPSMARGIKPGINRNDVYNKSIKLPPLAEQERIVTKLDAANSEFKNANEAIIKSKANYLALKSAILAKELQSSEAA